MKQYCTSEEDIETLFTYFQAAINGEENKESLKRLFDLQCGVMRSHPYQSERDTVLDDSLERLSAIEHEQWIEWSKNIASTEPNISFERVERWSNLWIPYEQLSDEMKEHDRKWARKIIKELRQAGEQE